MRITYINTNNIYAHNIYNTNNIPIVIQQFHIILTIQANRENTPYYDNHHTQSPNHHSYNLIYSYQTIHETISK